MLETSWQARTVEQPTAVAGALEAVEGYLVSERAARSSHETRQAVAEEADDPAPDPDGGGGGGAGYACYRWNMYGGYVGWCYDG